MTFKCLLGHTWGDPYDRTVHTVTDRPGCCDLGEKYIFWQTCTTCKKTKIRSKKVHF